MLKLFLAGLSLSYWVEHRLLGFIHPQNTMSDELESPNSFALRACQNIVNQTQDKLLYTIELDSDPTFVKFNQHLHEAFIQTIVISEEGKLTSAMFSYHSKNMIFIVNDVDELLSLILCSTSQQKPPPITGGFSTGSMSHRADGGLRLRSSFPHYCIQVDEHFLWSRSEKTCDKTIGLSSAELRDGSFLSDAVFNATRGLYVNKIWNSKNHLIFFMKNLRYNFSKSSPKPRQNSKHREFANDTLNYREIDPFSSVTFCFKFFWRFFKGRKAIICHPQGCEKYDPFTETLISFVGENDFDFFDFSWKNMHKKPMIAQIDFRVKSNMHVVNPYTWGKWFDFHVIAVKYLATSLNGTFKVGVADTLQSWFDLREEEDGLRCDINLHIFGENGVFLGDSDTLKIDFAVSIDTTAVCVAAPHSTFMSQGLVIFVSFTPIVWALTLITIFVLCFIQYFFQFSQYVIFDKLYSEDERDHFRGTSSMLTVYAYFVCGSPPSLISGRVVTGKILFVILSFFALIMSTAFLGSMTTLLSNRVLYAEIDSLKSLEESDLFIETLNAVERETDLNFLVDRSESLKAKLVDNHLFYEAEFYDEFASIDSFETLETFRNASLMLSTSNSNAFLVSMPFMSNPKESVIIKPDFQEPFEYHLVKECLMMHPLTMPILKNSIFYDKLNQVIAHMLETGHARRILDETSTDAVRWGNSSVREVNDEPRAYDMNDLQSAFIGLGVGLFFSCLAFIGELSIDIFQSSAPVKFFRRMNIS